MKKKKILLSWSGGIEAAVSFFELKSPDYKILGLLSFFETPHDRLKFHGIPFTWIQKQAEALETPLVKLSLAENASNEAFEETLNQGLKPWRSKGFEGIAFGSQTLDEIRTYLNNVADRLKFEAVYPIWNWQKDEVFRVFFGLGFKAVVVKIDLQKLPLSFIGRPFDRDFVNDLPSSVDPSGENGEFHVFVYDGPFFQKKVDFKIGEILQKENFAYAQILPPLDR